MDFLPSDITLEPSKLLLYGEGSSFLPYEAPKKSSGVIGSLTLCPPSEHQGGELYVWHEAREVAGKHYIASHHLFPIHPTLSFDIMACSWYWNISHKVIPANSGFCLSFSRTTDS